MLALSNAHQIHMEIHQLASVIGIAPVILLTDNVRVLVTWLLIMKDSANVRKAIRYT